MKMILIIGGLLALGALAARRRMKNNRWRMEQGAVASSPMAEALGQLIAIAGGIYLSLVMAASFLGVDQIDKVLVGQWAIDPLAVLAILLAFLQPIVLYWLRRILG